MSKYPYFTTAFKDVAVGLHKDNIARGFWEGGTKAKNTGEVIALIHSELSEALEAVRNGNPRSVHIPEFSGLEEELADVVIRIMDFSEANQFQVAEAILAKIDFNKTRPHKHGKKF